MTTTEKVHELIQKVKKCKLPPEELGADSRLRDDLGLDSLAQVELLVLAEDGFGVRFSRDEAQTVKTVGQMIAFIDSRLTAA